MRFIFHIIWLVLPALCCAEPVKIPASIIIDDLGYNLALGRRAIEIPGALSYAVLPQTPHAKTLAEFANTRNKEVLLHLPMEGDYPQAVEPSTLTTSMSESVFRETLRSQLQAIPHIVGVNNHMGSILTPQSQQMNWLMQELLVHDLFFIDSRTTSQTVASSAALHNAVRFSRRDVFLDHDKNPDNIRRAFQDFIRIAKTRQGAIAIAHPYPETLALLPELLEELQLHNIELVNVSRLIAIQNPQTATQYARAKPDAEIQNR